jgi:hypothetical protein
MLDAGGPLHRDVMCYNFLIAQNFILNRMASRFKLCTKSHARSYSRQLDVAHV